MSFLVVGELIDVLLQREDMRIACEISVSTSGAHELSNIRKCLDAGFDEVVVVSSRKRLLQHLKRRVGESCTTDEQSRIKLLSPQELLSFLDERQPSEQVEEATVAGYTAKVKVGAQSQSNDLGRVILSSLEKLKRRDHAQRR